jgi:hypothetical protein
VVSGVVTVPDRRPAPRRAAPPIASHEELAQGALERAGLGVHGGQLSARRVGEQSLHPRVGLGVAREQQPAGEIGRDGAVVLEVRRLGGVVARVKSD